MRLFAAAALALALAACGGAESGSDELIPAEPYKLGAYDIPAGVSFPDDAELYGRASQTINGVSQVSYSFKTGLTPEKLLEFFESNNMKFSKQDNDTYALYTGKLVNGTDIELRWDKVEGGTTADTIYLLTVGSAIADIPVSSGEVALGTHVASNRA